MPAPRGVALARAPTARHQLEAAPELPPQDIPPGVLLSLSETSRCGDRCECHRVSAELLQPSCLQFPLKV
ncbi:hypothetical protein SUZIE_182995 [Sciurus carolinensis]|uniref:Uncharacterized protein n=1 Tax=Sciurus carolinensis TaxID=30640 RepID=A0AA41T262_SCICA|nr:hypothetical protein [Sciurus carolinensis]